MSNRHGIDDEEGTVNVYAACPNEGDSVMIVNCGDHFEVRHHQRSKTVVATLTEDELDKLRQGHITWH